MSPVIVSSIGEYIRQQREQAKISLRQLASAAGVSNPYLSQVERGLRRPSAEILQQIAKGLRISAEALYVQAGILEDRRPDSGVRAAVLADTDITERQKQVLLEIYESFRRESALNADAPSSGSAEAAAAGASGRDPGSRSPGPAGPADPAGTGVRGRRRTAGTGTGTTGSTGGGPGAGSAPATGQAADSANGTGERPDGTGKESSGAKAPAHDKKRPARTAGQER